MQWARRFFADLAGSYLDSLHALKALPWLFAAIIAWEFAQHVVEVRIGMFANEEAARAVSQDGTRMVFGWLKMLSIYIGAFFVVRHFAGNRDGRPLAPTATAARRFAPYVVYSLFMFAAIFYAHNFVSEDRVDTLRTIVGLSQVLIEPLMMAWVVAAASDNRISGPLASARQTGWLYLLALPFYLLTRVPVSLLHQELNQRAIGTQGTELWSILVVDSVVVGVIVAITPAAMVRVARWVELKHAHIKTAPALESAAW